MYRRPEKKIISRDEASRIGRELRSSGKKLVFTNGCFDLLHPGHVDLLIRARMLGDVLMVGLNTDDSVRRLKGEKRPVLDEETRSKMLAAIEVVDYVVLFDEDTPIELIKSVMPSVLVKGGDYTSDRVVGREFVLERGGKVEILPLVEGYSTSSLLEKLLELTGE
ncbi:MAG TPA: D-glycero-beta-D-manno-heptose 1-phosphate adenylyltransferase [Firmicutes bacterium]|nr:D-glycero-beta-D-manno-heptose 1-phosphate adenylyltransferase [Bacillota bacterium]